MGARPEDRRLVPIGAPSDLARIAADFGQAAFLALHKRLPVPGDVLPVSSSAHEKKMFAAATQAYVTGAYLVKGKQVPTIIEPSDLVPGDSTWDDPNFRVFPLMLYSGRAAAMSAALYMVTARRHLVRSKLASHAPPICALTFLILPHCCTAGHGSS